MGKKTSFFKMIGEWISDKDNNKNDCIRVDNANRSDTMQQDAPKTTLEEDAGQKDKHEKDTSPGKEMTESPIEKREELSAIICKYLVDLECPLNGSYDMVVWFNTDKLTFMSYDDDHYRQSLQMALVNECDVKLNNVVFRNGEPAEDLRCTMVGSSGKVFLQFLDNQPVQTVEPSKAVVSIFGNAGSLLKEQCILSSDELKQKKTPSVYNIGAGEFPQLQTGFRYNHIAIDDNPNSPMFEKNKYVSRTHAHIGYSDMFGFYLQVEREGSRLMGKRTRIFRGEKKIELDNPQVKVPLQNGDLIELGKSVILSYVEIKE